MRKELERIADIAKDQIPSVLGELETLRAELMQRLLAPVQEPDRLLTAEQVATRLACSVPFVYSHQEELGGVRLSERALRFSATAVERFIERASG
jgi:predicted DNA-binding transcriptional regulator AlpA